MTTDTDTAEAVNDGNGVSLTDEVHGVDAYVTMYVDRTKTERYAIGFGFKADDVDRPFWDSVRHTEAETDPIFGTDVIGTFRDVADSYVKPNDGGPYTLAYDNFRSPAVCVWSRGDDAYMVVRDRDRIVVDVGDGFGGTNRHEVDVLSILASRRSPRTATLYVETDDGDRREVDPTELRAVVTPGPEWVRDEDDDGVTGMVRADE